MRKKKKWKRKKIKQQKNLTRAFANQTVKTPEYKHIEISETSEKNIAEQGSKNTKKCENEQGYN